MRKQNRIRKNISNKSGEQMLIFENVPGYLLYGRLPGTFLSAVRRVLFSLCSAIDFESKQRKRQSIL